MLLSRSANSDEIIIAGDNWCPINCKEDASQPGYMIEVAIAIFEPLGYKVIYKEIPWKRAVDLARAGEIHGIVGAFKGDAPDFLFPEQSLLHITANNLFKHKTNSWTYNGLASLRLATIGVVGGYDYGDRLNNYIATELAASSTKVVELHGNDATKRGIQLLMKNRVDVFVEAGPVFWYQATKSNIAAEFVDAGHVEDPEPCYIAFSPTIASSTTLVEHLNTGLQKLKAQKQLIKIANKYGLPANLVKP